MGVMTVRSGHVATRGATRRITITRRVALAVCVTSSARAQLGYLSQRGALSIADVAHLNRTAFHESGLVKTTRSVRVPSRRPQRASNAIRIDACSAQVRSTITLQSRCALVRPSLLRAPVPGDMVARCAHRKRAAAVLMIDSNTAECVNNRGSVQWCQIRAVAPAVMQQCVSGAGASVCLTQGRRGVMQGDMARCCVCMIARGGSRSPWCERNEGRCGLPRGLGTTAGTGRSLTL